MIIIFEMTIKKRVIFLKIIHFTKVLTKPSLKGSVSLSNVLQATINFSSNYNINQIRWSSVHIIIIDNGKLSTIYRCSVGRRYTFKQYTIMMLPLYMLL